MVMNETSIGLMTKSTSNISKEQTSVHLSELYESKAA